MLGPAPLKEASVPIKLKKWKIKKEKGVTIFESQFLTD
jgi:hypothetical protein